MNIKQILSDWQNGYTHGEIKQRHNLTVEQEFAITECSTGLTVEQIEIRLANLKPDMKAAEIKAAMSKQLGLSESEE